MTSLGVGQLVTARELREGVQQTLETWLPPTLAELARRAGRVAPGEPPLAKTPAPRTWTRLPDFRAIRPDQSPALVVTSPGLAEEAIRDGEGNYSATWTVSVFVVVRGDTYEETTDLVGLYVGAIRAVLLQHPIEELASSRTWMGEAYDALDHKSARTVGAGVCVFRVTVRDVVESYAGATPEVPEPPEYVWPEDREAEEAIVRVRGWSEGEE